jgi:endo-1,4-beta-D-glucanase Y
MTTPSVLGACALTVGLVTTCTAQEWTPLWRSYAAAFMDGQIRVIDRDDRDRTTSEGQAYALFFALVANDRPRFDRLLHWTARNIADGDLGARLPAWLWGQAPDGQWRVLDDNSASDADVWMAYTLLEAGLAWKEPRYTALGQAIAARIAADETALLPEFGWVLVPGGRGFKDGDSYRLNVSYVPLQVFVRLGDLLPDGPWRQIAANIPALVGRSAPHGFASDWLEAAPGPAFAPSGLASYDAIRVYLWAGMLDAATPGRDPLLKALPGMAGHLRTTPVPPAKVNLDGTIADPNGPVGFSAALLPYLAALGETELERGQRSRVRAQLDRRTGLYGTPGRYYDQNLVLFALGAMERVFWFDARGALHRTRSTAGR